jgi:type IV pilus assembly protein PilY1
VLGLDNNATPYVFAGTGRLWTTSDQGTTAQQAIYGLKDYSETLAHPTSNCTTPSACVTDLTANLLVDNGVTVDTNGNVAGGPATTFANLVADATNNCVGSPLPSPCYDGWVYSALALGNTATQTGSERVLNSQDLLGGELFTTTYIPNTSLCGGNGTSNLFAQNYQTGTATPSSSPPFGTGTGGSVNLSMSLGAGAGSSPSLVLTPSAGGGSGTAPALESCVQTSTGAIVCTPLGTIPGAANGEVSWRTLRNNN